MCLYMQSFYPPDEGARAHKAQEKDQWFDDGRVHGFSSETFYLLHVKFDILSHEFLWRIEQWQLVDNPVLFYWLIGMHWKTKNSGDLLPPSTSFKQEHEGELSKKMWNVAFL